MYDVYISDVLLPVTPSKLTVKIKNQNKTVSLINEGQVNLIKQAGLTGVSFTMLIPQQKYPFARYPDGKFKKAFYYLDMLRTLKFREKPFTFIISRYSEANKKFHRTNITVTLEDYTIKEDEKSGTDIEVDVNLLQYRKYGTVTVTAKETAGVMTITEPIKLCRNRENLKRSLSNAV